MTTHSTRLFRRYSTIMALGFMTVVSKLAKAMRAARSGARDSR